MPPTTDIRSPKENKAPFILVVEDDQNVRNFISEALMSAGFRVESSPDGETGWTAIKTLSPDVVVTDQNMPNLCGSELLKRMRGANIMTPVVMITGTFPLNLDCLKSDAVLLKPCSANEIIETVLRLVK